MSIYEKRTQQREQLKEQANKSLLFLLQQMQSGICHNEKIAEQMQLLSKRLMNTHKLLTENVMGIGRPHGVDTFWR